MNKYVEYLWKESVHNEYLLGGHNILPYPTTQPITMDAGTSRELEVLTLSLLYDNNLLNSFLYRYNRTVFTSPLCDCGSEEQTATHLLFRCELVNSQLRSHAYIEFRLAVGNELADADSNIALLNASRSTAFICSVVTIVNSLKDRLRSHIELTDRP